MRSVHSPDKFLMSVDGFEFIKKEYGELIYLLNNFEPFSNLIL